MPDEIANKWYDRRNRLEVLLQKAKRVLSGGIS